MSVRPVMTAALGLALAAMPGVARAFDAIRDRQPVVLAGSDVPALLGRAVGDIWAYRYEASGPGFVQVPLQVDERRLHDLTQGQYDPVYEMTYDWFGLDDGLLDADDEVVFMAGDAGERAPDVDAWVAGAEDQRVELRIEDPLGGTAWLYLYTSSTIVDADPSFSYVSYTAPDPGSGIAEVETDHYLIGFQGRWLLTQLQVGTGPDLLDRVKVRGYALVGSQTEETYDGTSELLGARTGKVRAIREVQGAASGPLTTHIDVFYEQAWQRIINLRVHAMPHIWAYFDYLPPASPGVYFSASLPSGLAIDGAVDVPASLVQPSWSQVSLPDGTIVMYQRELSPFPVPDPGAACAAEAGDRFYWQDSSGFDDLTGEDGLAIGNHGTYLQCTGDTNADPYSSSTVHYLLPAQSPYSPIGPDHALREENPLQVMSFTQTRGSLADAILETVSPAGGGRIHFSWIDALGEDSYDIYRGTLVAPFLYAHGTQMACSLPAQTTSWSTPDDQEGGGQPSYYYLVAPRREAERLYGTDSSGATRPPSPAPCP